MRGKLHLSAIYFLRTILGTADASNCAEIRNALSCYSKASGQVINLHKSSVTFSPNMTPLQKILVFDILGLQHIESHDIYPGLPAFVGCSKRRVFDGIKQQVWRKLQAWKGNFFLCWGEGDLNQSSCPIYSSICHVSVQNPSWFMS